LEFGIVITTNEQLQLNRGCYYSRQAMVSEKILYSVNSHCEEAVGRWRSKKARSGKSDKLDSGLSVVIEQIQC